MNGTVILCPPREVVHDVQVALDPGGDIRPLDLDDHLLPRVRHHGQVHLRDRRAGQRLLVESREDLLERLAESGGRLLADDLDRHLGDVVLKLLKLGNGLRRQQIGAGREDLPELDEGRTELLDRHPQALRRGVRDLVLVRVLHDVLDPDGLGQAHAGDERTEAMFGEHANDLS